MIGELLFENGFLTSCALYGTICISAGLIVSLLLRRSAARAHQALLLAMVAAVLVPVMSTLVRHYELGIFSARGASAPALATESTIMPGLIRPVVPAFTSPDLEYYAGVTEEYYPAATAVAPAPAAAPFPWRIALLALWLGVGVILLVRLIVTFILGRRLLGKAAPVTSQAIRLGAERARRRLGISRPILLLSSDKIASPVIWCWAKRPALLLPTNATDSNRTCDWAALFCHELAHLRRLDHVTGLLAELLVCIHLQTPTAMPVMPARFWTSSRSHTRHSHRRSCPTEGIWPPESDVSSTAAARTPPQADAGRCLPAWWPSA